MTLVKSEIQAVRSPEATMLHHCHTTTFSSSGRNVPYPRDGGGIGSIQLRRGIGRARGPSRWANNKGFSHMSKATLTTAAAIGVIGALMTSQARAESASGTDAEIAL